MRLAAQEVRIEPPDSAKAGIEQLHAAIGAKNGNALVEVVDGLALHLGQGVVAALQRQAVGDVLVGQQAAAEGMRRDHRSEEHTSELQSLMRISYDTFCLKKTNTK